MLHETVKAPASPVRYQQVEVLVPKIEEAHAPYCCAPAPMEREKENRLRTALQLT